jgi:adenosine deaminase
MTVLFVIYFRKYKSCNDKEPYLISYGQRGMSQLPSIKKNSPKPWLHTLSDLRSNSLVASPSAGPSPSMLSQELVDFIKGMPKTALHMHLEGSLEAPMAFKFAQKYNMIPLSVPKAGGGTITVNTLKDLENVYNFEDLESFLNVYNTLATTLKNKEDFTELAFAYCQKAMSENIKHAEIFFDPQTHLSRGLSFADVVDGIQDGLEKGRVKGLNIQLICSFLRDHPVGNVTDLSPDYRSKNPDSTPTAWDTIKQCVQYNKTTLMAGGAPGARAPTYLIVGMGLDNDEVGFPPELFQPVYSYGMKNGLFAVAHGGEEGPPEYIWECIKNIKCIRVDHGVRSIEDPQLVSYLATPQTSPQILKFYGEPHQIPVTVCPLSNYKLAVFPDPTRTNIVEMLDMGIVATVNSDDPAYFGGYVTENYLMLLKNLDSTVAKGRPIDLADIKRLCLNGFNASVLPTSKKLAYINEVNNYFLTSPGLLYKTFVNQYSNK